MDDVTIALALHVMAVVVWIGGVAMVTTVLLPAVRRFRNAEERVAFFEAVERRFAWQARATTLLAGAMVLLWLIFTFMLFVAEPLFLDRWFEKRAKMAPDSTFALIQRSHWLLLILSLVTIFGGVAGSHGLSLFN